MALVYAAGAAHCMSSQSVQERIATLEDYLWCNRIAFGTPLMCLHLFMALQATSEAFCHVQVFLGPTSHRQAMQRPSRRISTAPAWIFSSPERLGFTCRAGRRFERVDGMDAASTEVRCGE